MFLNETRKEYTKYQFDKESALENPFDQFGNWYEFAEKNALFEPNSMSISTSYKNKPSNRIVLLKKYDKKGFTFFTNFNSKKSKELSLNKNIAATFFWPNLERQIRIEGYVEKISDKESDEYFDTRPRDSQLSAWASNQSDIINDRDELEKKLIEFKQKFPNKVPRPEFWGGYQIIPEYFEFWQGRANRYHDRICYEKNKKNWNMFRLNP